MTEGNSNIVNRCDALYKKITKKFKVKVHFSQLFENIFLSKQKFNRRHKKIICDETKEITTHAPNSSTHVFFFQLT